MGLDILPESRTRDRKGSIPSVLGTLIPIYCANCGKPYGMVPDSMITFAFALCQPCAESGLGDLAHFYEEPDNVFWGRVNDAMLEDQKSLQARGVLLESTQEDALILDPQGLAAELDNASSPLAKLAREWQARVSKEI